MDQQLTWAEMVAHQILPFVQRGITSYTAHDINHCIRVIEYTNKIIEILNRNGADLSQTEVKLLYLAGWLHDIGNLRCSDDTREKHSEESQEMLKRLIEKNNFLEGSKGMYSSLGHIVLHHQSKYDIARLDKEYKIDNDLVRLRMLCAAFRLADACHMGPDRANSLVYSLIEDQLGDTAKAHWKANNAIMSVDFETKDNSITVTVTSKKEAEMVVKAFKKEFERTKQYLHPHFPFRIVKIHEVTPKEILRDPLRRKAIPKN